MVRICVNLNIPILKIVYYKRRLTIFFSTVKCNNNVLEKAFVSYHLSDRVNVDESVITTACPDHVTASTCFQDMNINPPISIPVQE